MGNIIFDLDMEKINFKNVTKRHFIYNSKYSLLNNLKIYLLLIKICIFN